MPSRNSINKPKNKIHQNSHASSIGKKRAARAKSTTRSSTSRYNEDATPRPTDSKSVALYTGNVTPTTITNKTLSTKKAKKLARNQKYIEKRLLKDLDEQMQLDDETNDKTAHPSSLIKIKSKTKQTSETEIIRKLLMETVANKNYEPFKVATDSEGTTIGIQSF